MIELKHLGKIYSSASGSVEALKDVNLTIADGEIFGIIGLSGAGKSTLVRCINLLERPTSGEVWVDGRESDDAQPEGTSAGSPSDRYDLPKLQFA